MPLHTRFARAHSVYRHTRVNRAVSEALEQRYLLATFNVLNNNDAGAGSLRQAITDANTAVTADTIQFDAAFFGVPRTISLLTALPTFTALGSGLVIDGPGASLLTVRRDPGAATSFRIFDSSAPTLTISGMTVTGGNPVGTGGGLNVPVAGANVLLDEVVFRDNTPSAGGGAVCFTTASFLTVRNSIIANNTASFGGAIDMITSGSLVIENSTISGNTATANSLVPAGGVYFFGVASAAPPPGFTANTLVIRNSTFNNNVTNFGAGGAVGLAGFTGTLLAQNSTFTGNTAATSGGAIAQISGAGGITVQNSTLTGNTANGAVAGTGGGGIARTSATAGTTTVVSSIVSGNNNANAPDILSSGVTTTNVNFSAVGSNLGFVLVGANNLPFATPLLLNALANNGGPTQTISFAATSPLIDAGSNPAALTTDQRGTGFDRQVGTGVDIGALELEQQTFVVTNNNDSGAGSLRAAMTSANATLTPDEITFDPAFFNVPRTISLLTAMSSLSNSADALTITGPGKDLLTIRRDPAAVGSMRFVLSNVPVLQISGATFTAFNGNSFGGVIQGNVSGQNLIFDGVSFTGNMTTSGGGGAIALVQSNSFLTLRNSTVSNNTAVGFGGGIDWTGSAGGSFFIEGSTISGNVSGGGTPGGGLYFSGTVSAAPPAGYVASTLVVRNSTIANNSAPGNGGGISLNSVTGTLLIQDSTIAGNTSAAAVGGGGGISRTGLAGIVTVQNSVISGNTNAVAPDLLNAGTTNVNFSAVGSNLGFVLSGTSGNNLPFGAALGLGPLADNGGPTQTMLPAVTSPLFNAGSNVLVPVGMTTDQRGAGFPRIIGPAVDIGAVEIPILLVTNANDAGLGSLRQAITDSNASPGNEQIFFDTAGVFATPQVISLQSALPTIALSGGDLTINGPGASSLTVRRDPTAATAFRIFTAANLQLTINKMTISGGTIAGDGGAISVAVGSDLVLDSMVIRENATSSDGGAINLSGDNFLTLRNSTVSGNTAGDDGGGIYFFSGGSLLMENSTVSGNDCRNDDGGGIYFFGTVSLSPPPGFIPSTLVIRNSTIANNVTAGGGGGVTLNAFAGTLLLQNSTVTGNTAKGTGAGNVGGGIGLQTGTGTISLVSTIVSGNFSGNGADIGSTLTVNANFSAIGSPVGFTLSGSSGNNLPFLADLKLGLLGNYGGVTQTIAPMSTSPVVDAGSNPLGLATDQRGAGFARVVGVAADVGAYEVQNVILVTNNNDAGAGSLRDAINQSNGTAAFDMIEFSTAFFNVPRTISLLTGLPSITDELSIVGTGASMLTIRRDPGAAVPFPLFNISAPVVNLVGMTLTGASNNFFGAALSVTTASNITLDRMVISGNTTTSAGGAAVGMFAGGFLTIRQSTLSNNRAAGFAGGIDLFGGDIALVIQDSTLSGNTASGGEGGALYVGYNASSNPPVGFVAETILIRNSTIHGNTAATSGGGIASRLTSGRLLIQNSTISGNTATTIVAGQGGGGIGRPGGPSTITLQNSIVSGNNNVNGPDILSAGTVNANFSAIGSATGFALSGSSGNNLAFGTNLLLGILTNNGGPTETRLPSPGSPLINAGSNALTPLVLTNDQRGLGFARTLGGTVDIGAVERDDTPPTPGTSQFGFQTFPQYVSFGFSENVGASLSVADLTLINLTIPQVIPPANIQLTYDNGSNTGLYTFPGFANGILPDGDYSAVVNAAGVTDASGNALTANATASFFFLNGDATRDRQVNSADFNVLATNFGGSGKLFTQGNFSYDPAGNVNSADFNILATQFGKVLVGSGDSARGSSSSGDGGAGGVGSGSSGLFGDRKIGDDDDDSGVLN